MADFNLAVEKTLSVEGVFSDHPKDTGGKTKYGITERRFRQALALGVVRGVERIEDLTVQQARDIYYHFEWVTMRLDHVLDQEIAEEIFDTAVNCGVGIAARILQETLRVYDRGIVVDGVVGPVTIGTVNRLSRTKHRRAILKTLNILQGYRYFRLATDNPDQYFWSFDGWVNNRVKL